MSSPAIRVEGLGKQYRYGLRIQSNTLRDVFSHAVRHATRILRSPSVGSVSSSDDAGLFWALRALNFQVPQGQTVGLVGSNGAGKSTLLKVLCRITEPTVGRAEIRGRVGSLIEVGTGFHSELTGRENTFLSGAILGMGRAEIAHKFDEIVAFAGVEKFVDTPLKHYSSGMQLRLGFAVAAHLEAEILIVDEVLAVGDAEFQRKCLSTMLRLARDGRTVLFVSHNATAVRMLCSRAIWLDKGEMKADGSPEDVLAQYFAAYSAQSAERLLTHDAAIRPTVTALTRMAVRPVTGTSTDPIIRSSPFVIDVEYWDADPDGSKCVALALFNEQETLLLQTVQAPPSRRVREPGLRRASCQMPAALFVRGLYRLEVGLLDEHGRPCTEGEDLHFTILDPDDDGREWFRHRPGVIRPNLEWVESVGV